MDNGEDDGCGECAIASVISRSDSAPLLEFVKGALDKVSHLIEAFPVAAFYPSGTPGRNDGFSFHVATNEVHNHVAIVAFIG